MMDKKEKEGQIEIVKKTRNYLKNMLKMQPIRFIFHKSIPTEVIDNKDGQLLVGDPNSESKWINHF
jgi:hypothetical protein